MVVVGPGQRLRVGRVPARRPGRAQPLRRPALFADHQLQPVDQLLASAGPPVVGGGGGGVQRGGPDRDLRGEARAAEGGQVGEERLHDIPGRYLHPVEAGPHAHRVAPGEDPEPPLSGVESCCQIP